MPEWFRKVGIVEYIFLKELVAINIETPGFTKINIYCESEDKPYDGGYFDNVTNIRLSTNWDGVQEWTTSLFIDYCICQLVVGVTTVLDEFKIPAPWLDDIAHRTRILATTFLLPIGKKKEKISSGHFVRLYVRPRADLSACVVVLILTKGKNVVAEREICTTFPSPSDAIERFKSLSVVEGSNVIVKFRTAGANGRKIYDRINFDHTGMIGVERVDQDEPKQPFFTVEPTFKVDISELLTDP